MHRLKQKLADWARTVGALLRRSGFSIALSACLVLIGGAAYVARTGARIPTPAPPQATVSPVAMTPQSVDRLDDALNRDAQELLWPVSGREILMPYSATEPLYNKTLDLWTLHEGVDILAAPGEAVLSACDGTVTSAHMDPLLGYTIEVRRDDGLIARYSNLVSAGNVTAGMKVQRGQVIGSVGATAETESLMKPHLHYAAFKDGKWALPDEAAPVSHEEYAEQPE